MKLDEYLVAKDISTSAFAEMVGLNPSTIWRIREGKVRPDWKTMDAIACATNGAVTPNDFLPEQPANGSIEAPFTEAAP